MKKYLLILLCALVSCVGQTDDPEDDNPSGGGDTPTSGVGIVLDFTATWCVNCPRMTTAIEEAAAERPIIPICVHFKDDYANAQGQELINHFGVSAYPSAVMNMDQNTLITATSKDLILAKLDAASSGKEPCTIEASFGEDGRFNITVTAVQEGEYTLSAAILSDGNVHPQTGDSDTYVHNNVFTEFIQYNLLGDPLGQLEAGASAQLGYYIRELINTDHIVIFVCHNGIVNSAIDFKPW